MRCIRIKSKRNIEIAKTILQCANIVKNKIKLLLSRPFSVVFSDSYVRFRSF